MEKPILKDPNLFPDNDLLKSILQDSYPAYEEFIARITNEDVGLNPEWIFYNDVRAWLCKISFKKKTIIWMSAQEKFFRITFYFNPKTVAHFYELPIDKALKDAAIKSEGKKFIPVTFEIRDTSHFDDIMTIIDCKKKAG